ncbi:MAG: VCBS repeat-containing protein [Enterobacterales bacterium]|nr:VCBS repeat-containing protein [Enterobacterales bacterium]
MPTRLFCIAVLSFFSSLLSSPNVSAACLGNNLSKSITTDYRGANLTNTGCGTNLPPEMPAWIQVPALDEDGTFDLTYAAAKNASTYRVERTLVSQNNFQSVYVSPGQIYRESSLAEGSYTYRVKACNLSGVCSAYQTSSIIVIRYPSVSPPGPIGDSTRDLVSDAVGSVAGDFRVNEGGQASYTIPIYAPTGVAGIAASVGLSYSSGGGNGLLGIGWNLSAYDFIARCGQTKAIDSIANDVSLDYDDRFCFAGERLILVDGVYGQPNSEYRTRNFSLTKITAHGSNGSGPSYFEVRTSDGDISFYGASNDSRVRANIGGVVQSTVTTWAKTSTADRYSNQINYTYYNDEANGEFYIENISYSPTVNITFNYDQTRPDVFQGYSLGGKRQLKVRLVSIVVSDNNIEVRRYDLDYGLSRTEFSRLESITESKDGVSLQPTTFNWSDPVNQILPDSRGTKGIHFYHGAFANVDGDNKPDFVSIQSSGSSSSSLKIYEFDGEQYALTCSGSLNFSALQSPGFKAHDLDGDGLDEVIVTSTGLITAYKVTNCQVSYQILTSFDSQDDDWFFGDINGDGLPDIIYPRSGQYYVKFKLPDSVFGQYSAENPVQFSISSFSIGTNKVSQKLASYGDFNFDGRVDMLTKVTNTVEVPIVGADSGDDIQFNLTYKWMIFTSDGDGNFTEYASAGDLGFAITENKDMKLVDLNGDGLSDLVYRNQIAGEWYYKLFTGTEFLAGQTLHVFEKHPIYFSDQNQNGLVEVLHIENNRIHSREFGRAGYLPTSSINLNIVAERGQLVAQVDLNSDGELDIITVEPKRYTFDSTEYFTFANLNTTSFIAADKITKLKMV